MSAIVVVSPLTTSSGSMETMFGARDEVGSQAHSSKMESMAVFRNTANSSWTG